MREFAVHLRSVQDVQDFVDLATTRPFVIRVSDGHHCVDAKSFMEMFCLNLREPLVASFRCSDEEYEKFHQDAARFLV